MEKPQIWLFYYLWTLFQIKDSIVALDDMIAADPECEENDG